MKLLNNILRDEKYAPIEYSRLIKNKNLTKTEKQQLRRSRRQEIRHRKKLLRIKRKLNKQK